MDKIFTKLLLFVTIFTALAFGHAFAQTIAIGAFTQGPYAPGSSISIPFTVTGCVKPNTTYNLYLSNNLGAFVAPKKLIGTFTNFYATFVNGAIPPAGILAGTAYEVEVDAVSGGVVIATAVSTTPITIDVPAVGVVAAVTSQAICSGSPNVFGTFNPNTGTTNYTFIILPQQARE